MITKIIMGLLLCCLIVVVGFFLYSDHQLQSERAVGDTAESVNNNAPPSAEKVTAEQAGLPTTADDITATQPDKSLPIPAHKLKKLIADKPPTTDTELDQKVQAANESIAALDKELQKQLDQNPSQQPATTEATSDNTEDEKSEEIKKRLEHLRDHLNKNP